MFSIDSKEFSKALRLAGRFAKERTTLPELSHIRLETIDGGVLKISSTNLTQGISVTYTGINVVRPAVALAPYKLLQKLVDAWYGPIDIAYDEATSELKLSNETTTVSIACLKDTFPPTNPEATPLYTIYANFPLFNEITRRVAYCASTDDARPVLTTIKIALDEDGDTGKLTFAASDGFRLAVDKLPINTIEYFKDGRVEFLVPAKTLLEVKKLTRKGEFSMAVSGRGESPEPEYVTFTLPGDPTIKITSIVVMEHFPDYKKIFPGPEEDHVFSFKAQDMRRALAREAAIRAKNMSDIIHLDVDFDKKEIVMVGKYYSEGTWNNLEEHIKINTVEGHGTGIFKIAFKPRFFQEFLVGDEIAISQKNNKLPARFRVLEYPDWIGVLMPCHAGD